METSFRFTFSEDNERLLKVTDIPTGTIDGWRFTQRNPPVVRHDNDYFTSFFLSPCIQISEDHVVDYSSSKGAEPPYIQLLLKPVQPDATDELSHAVPIEGIQASSVESNVQWSIEVSKNDLLPIANASTRNEASLGKIYWLYITITPSLVPVTPTTGASSRTGERGM